jgi:hypothetical protein
MTFVSGGGKGEASSIATVSFSTSVGVAFDILSYFSLLALKMLRVFNADIVVLEARSNATTINLRRLIADDGP